MYKKYIYDEISKNWWKKNICNPLHIINNIRFNYIKSKIIIKNKNILDVGCGGGFLSEKLSKHGAIVTGIDKSKELIKIAKNRNKKSKIKIKYFNKDLINIGKDSYINYDIIICMEILEHLFNKDILINFLNEIKNKIIILSSLKKNIITYIYMILLGEYITKNMILNTHEYENFINIFNFINKLKKRNIQIIDIKELKYNFLLNYSNLEKKICKNYIIILKLK